MESRILLMEEIRPIFAPYQIPLPEVSRGNNLEVYGNLCGSESYLWEFVTYSFSLRKFQQTSWNIPQTPNYLFRKENLAYLYFGVLGVCSRGSVGIFLDLDKSLLHYCSLFGSAYLASTS